MTKCAASNMKSEIKIGTVCYHSLCLKSSFSGGLGTLCRRASAALSLIVQQSNTRELLTLFWGGGGKLLLGSDRGCLC